MFHIPSGDPISVTFEGNSNTDIVSAELNGNILKLTAGNQVGGSTVTIRGSVGDETVVDFFNVTVSNQNVIELLNEDFESDEFPPTGWEAKGSSTIDGELQNVNPPNWWDFWFRVCPSTWTNPLYINSGVGAAGIGYSPIVNFSWLISPEVELEEGSSELYYRMFYKSATPSYFTILHIMVSIDGGDFELLKTIKYEETIQIDTSVQQFDDLSEYSGNKVRVAFVFENNGAYQFTLDDIRIESEDISDIKNTNIPKSSILLRNYPNPFNPTTNVKFVLNTATNVELTIYNVKGEFVKNLVNGFMEKGSHSVVFDAGNLESGVYYYSLKANGKTSTNKMILIK